MEGIFVMRTLPRLGTAFLTCTLLLTVGLGPPAEGTLAAPPEGIDPVTEMASPENANPAPEPALPEAANPVTEPVVPDTADSVAAPAPVEGASTVTEPAAQAGAGAVTEPAPQEPGEWILTLEQALAWAEANNPGLRLAAYQVAAARQSLTVAPAQAESLAPLASAYLMAQYSIAIPQEAITPRAASEQARVDYEQAVAQYYSARQQVRAGTVQAYVEWQRAMATIEAQRAALERTLTQKGHVEAALAVGTAAPYDLLQIEAAVAGQQAALSGAQAMEAAARSALGQIIGTPLASGVRPEPNQIESSAVTLPENVDELVALAMQRRPDLREKRLTLAERRLQAGISGVQGTALVQLQSAANQYEQAAAQARSEVTQALLAAQGALEELRAREQALAPAREALRLAQLRYEADLATGVEVQSASAAVLEAEASRIAAAANLTLRLFQLQQATGEM